MHANTAVVLVGHIVYWSPEWIWFLTGRFVALSLFVAAGLPPDRLDLEVLGSIWVLLDKRDT